ncbi:MAG: hypothetical protein ACFFBD_03130 [Candidatus Hodarchaeota archaeon]
MFFQEEWAVFGRDLEVTWTYGDYIDQEFAQLAVGLAKGLNDLGLESFKEGVASIRITDYRRIPHKTNEVFILNHGSFYFIAGNPLSTAKLLRKEKDIPTEILDILRGVMVGQASLLYANLWTEAEDDYTKTVVDQVFQDSFNEMGRKSGLGAEACSGECSFSDLQFHELMFLHSYLRERFRMDLDYRLREPWACITRQSGAKTYLSYKMQYDVLPTFLSIIFSMISTLFEGSVPTSLVFGHPHLWAVDIFSGEFAVFAASNPRALFRDPEFLSHFAKIEEGVLKDIFAPLTSYFIEGAVDEQRSTLNILAKIAQIMGKK